MYLPSMYVCDKLSSKKHILDYFPEKYFWDTKSKGLDIGINAKYIIEKVMMQCISQIGFDSSVSILEELYSKEFIASVISNSKELTVDTLRYAKERYSAD